MIYIHLNLTLSLDDQHKDSVLFVNNNSDQIDKHQYRLTIQMRINLMHNNKDNLYKPPSFYQNLQHYHSLCNYQHQHRPQHQYQLQQHYQDDHHESLSSQEEQQQQQYAIILVNQGWWKSFLCITMMNLVFIAIYMNFLLDKRLGYYQKNNGVIRYSENYTVIVVLMVVTLGMINISYLLTQFLNPGIRNLRQISQHQLSQAQKLQFCAHCQQYKTQHFTHCPDCSICIWNYDHHCGFFSKCIGGKAQLTSFYTFLASVTIAFIALLILMCIELGDPSE